MRQLFVSENLDGKSEIKIEGDDYRHLTRSLRARGGEALRLVDPQGQAFHAQIRAIDRRAVHVLLGERQAAAGPSRSIRLGLCIVAGDAFDASLDAAVQLGVSEFIPIQSARSKSLGHAKQERWERIAKEAACQSFRLSLPKISQAKDLDDFLAESEGRRFIAAPRASNRALTPLGPQEAFSLLIGPEGGWEDAELKGAAEKGWQALSLGSQILRVPVATVAALSYLQSSAWGIS